MWTENVHPEPFLPLREELDTTECSLSLGDVWLSKVGGGGGLGGGGGGTSFYK